MWPDTKLQIIFISTNHDTDRHFFSENDLELAQIAIGQGL